MDLIRSLNEGRLPQDVQDVLKTLNHIPFLLKLCLNNMGCDLILLHLPLSFQQDVLFTSVYSARCILLGDSFCQIYLLLYRITVTQVSNAC